MNFPFCVTAQSYLAPKTVLLQLEGEVDSAHFFAEVIAGSDNNVGKHSQFILLFCLQILKNLSKNVHKTKELKNSK